MIDQVRVEAVAKALASVSDYALDVIEENDPQYRAVKMIAERHGWATLAIVVANALISYKLRLPGEDYWTEYARWWLHRPTPRSGEDIVKTVEEFLKAKGVAANVEQKEARLAKALPLIHQLLEEKDVVDLKAILEASHRTLKQKGYSKTLHFAAKMAYYVARALGVRVVGVDSEVIEIPVDRRMALLTSSSGMVRACPSELYTRLRDLATRAWRMVARASGKPVVRLDALVWLPARGVEEKLRRGLLASARDDYARRLVLLSRNLVSWQTASNVASQILYINPYASCKTP